MRKLIGILIVAVAFLLSAFAGTNTLESVVSTGNISADSITVTNASQFKNGVTSLKNNGQSPVSITPGTSPFSWTNNVAAAQGGGNVMVYIGGATSNIGLNGTSLEANVFTGLTSITLQTNDYLTVTFSSPPTMSYRPF